MDLQLVADVAARVTGAADAEDALAGTAELLEARLGLPVRADDAGRLAVPGDAGPGARLTIELANAMLDEGARLRQIGRLAALGQLTAGLSHELSNTLGAIGLHAAAIEAEVDPRSTAAAELREVRHLTDTSTELVRRVLAISRGSAPPPARQDLGRVLRGAADRLHRAAGAHAELKVSVTDEPCVVAMSRGGAEHVLLNLVANARDALPDGGTITVDLACDGDLVRLTVADTGHGMPEHVRRRVLEPFFTTRGADGGTGIGLAVVAEIVGHAGGTVDVESAEGDGATFSVTLPLARD